MTRVLLVNHAAQMGGAELILLDVARHLGARCRVVLFADGPLAPALRAAGIDVEILAGGGAMMGVGRSSGALRAFAAVPAVGSAVLALRRAARGFDVVYANSQKAAVVAMAAGLLSRTRIVWHMHDILSAEHFGGVQRRVSIALANAAARRVIVISEVARRSFVDAGGDGARVVTVPNGIDAALFPGASGTGGEPGAGRPTVGLFGRLAPWKGQHVLIDALAQLPGVDALVVGDALFGETEYRAALHARAAEAGVAGRCRFLGHRDDIPALMASVDLVVHCSTAAEPFGRVIVEAMLARRPVLASAHGASREILGDDYPGLVEPGDPARLAGAIREMLALPAERRRALVDANEARARRLFTLPRMIRDIDRVIADAVAA